MKQFYNAPDMVHLSDWHSKGIELGRSQTLVGGVGEGGYLGAEWIPPNCPWNGTSGCQHLGGFTAFLVKHCVTHGIRTYKTQIQSPLGE